MRTPIFNPLYHSLCYTSPLRMAPSAWVQHIPFGMFLIEILRPTVLVELGTQYGVSYCAFCQAVKELKLDTKCYAVDTWEGDLHSGYYGPDVLEDLLIHHEPLYSSFSQLIQSTFDEALHHFGDGSIDLLHIDGFHTYEAVEHDYHNWLPKMSDRGVILFHDINVRDRDFGVWKLWEKIKTEFRSFEFHHGHGLGLLAVGRRYSKSLRQILASSDKEANLIRSFFHQLGSRLETVEVNILRRMVREQRACILNLRAMLASMISLADRAVYDALCGEYLAGPGRIMVITKKRESLWCTINSLKNVELLPISDTYYIVDNADIEIMFNKDAMGNVTHASLRIFNYEINALKLR